MALIPVHAGIDWYYTAKNGISKLLLKSDSYRARPVPELATNRDAADRLGNGSAHYYSVNSELTDSSLEMRVIVSASN
jgi:hypothetical protein